MDAHDPHHETEYVHDFVQRSEPGQAVEPPPVYGRNLLGWIALTILFALNLASALVKQDSPEHDSQVVVSTVAPELKALIISREPGSKAVSPVLSGTNPPTFAKLLEKVEPSRRTEPFAALAYCIIRTEQKRPIVSADLEPFRKAKPNFQTALKVYSSTTITRAEYKDIEQKTAKTGGFLAQMLVVHAKQKAGFPDARASLRGPQNPLKLGIAIAGVGALIFLSFCAWVTFLVSRSGGLMNPLGLPWNPPNLVMADQGALKAAQLFTGFLVLSTAVALAFGRGSGALAAPFVTSLMMITFVFFTFRNGLRLTEIGVTTENLGRHIGLGVFVFLLEIPVALIMAAIGTKLFSFLPSATHPASTALMSTKDGWVIAGIFVQGAILAPFWEEIMFRGLLFPAVSRLSKSLWIGGISSCLLFAAIHPQGVSLWLALGTVAGASCLATYYTRSLVPSIVMHACHNGVLLLLTVLYS